MWMWNSKSHDFFRVLPRRVGCRNAPSTIMRSRTSSPNRRLAVSLPRLGRVLRRSPTAREHLLQVVTDAVAEECINMALRNAVKETTLLRQADHHIPRRFFQREPLDFGVHSESLTETYFKRLYRTSKEEFNSLLSLIESDLRRSRTRPLGIASSADPRVMLAVTMRYLAGAKVLDIGWPYRLGDTTFYSLLDETLECISSRLENIELPKTEDDANREAAAFQSLRDSPRFGIIGTLDGIAVAIKCPTAADSEDARKFHNRKGFYSISVQACVSSSCRFAYISAKHAGSTHDSTAFMSTALYQHLCLKEEDGGLPS
jgi:DDE superfamily endonuclease